MVGESSLDIPLIVTSACGIAAACLSAWLTAKCTTRMAGEAELRKERAAFVIDLMATRYILDTTRSPAREEIVRFYMALNKGFVLFGESSGICGEIIKLRDGTSAEKDKALENIIQKSAMVAGIDLRNIETSDIMKPFIP